MSRPAPIDPAQATGKTKSLLDAVSAKLGRVPNMMSVMAHSPAVLEGYLSFSGALSHDSLPPRLREQIALLVAEDNRCTYCLSAHTAIGKMVGLTPAETAAARAGKSDDAKAHAALRFARAVLTSAGAVRDEDYTAVRDSGLDDGEIAEIIAHVALNVFTNYFNKALRVPVDFPVVSAAAA